MFQLIFEILAVSLNVEGSCIQQHHPYLTTTGLAYICIAYILLRQDNYKRWSDIITITISRAVLQWRISQFILSLRMRLQFCAIDPDSSDEKRHRAAAVADRICRERLRTVSSTLRYRKMGVRAQHISCSVQRSRTASEHFGRTRFPLHSLHPLQHLAARGIKP